jgi:transcriptional regulator GlxA family with amidase domain
MPKSIGILLFDGAEELDFVGPWEIFTATADLNDSTCTVFTASHDGGVVTCRKGLKVVPDHSFQSSPHADVILVPGGEGVFKAMRDDVFMEHFGQVSRAAEVTTSVCTGAFVLAQAGLLNHKRATTHWALVPQLRHCYPQIDVVDDERYVDLGPIVTSAGISAGIDLALYMVGRFWGPEQARKSQKYTQYFPEPPYEDTPIPDMPPMDSEPCP